MWVILGVLCAVLTVFGGITVFLVRYALLPYMEKRWSAPFERMVNEFKEVKMELIIFARAFDGHLSWSQQEVDRIWNEFERRRQARNRKDI
jgi:hypothetical protein